MKRFTLFFIILSMVLMGCGQPRVMQDDLGLKIWVIGDPHYIDSTLSEGPLFDQMLENSDGRLESYCDEIIDALIAQCLVEHPDIVLLVGDLSFNGERYSHQTLAKKLSALTEKGIQALVIPGNHDIENPRAYNFSTEQLTYTYTISPEEFAEIYHNYGYSDETKRDPNSLSYVYPINERCWLLCLDSAEYENNNAFFASAGGSIREGTKEWMEGILKEAQEKNIQVISTMHHTLADIVGGTDYQIKNAKSIQQMFFTYGVIANLCGHSHAQYIKEIKQDDQTIYDIMTSALIIYSHQFGEIRWDPDKQLTYDTKKLDMASYVKKNRIKDPFLQDFENSARKYFKEYSTKRLGSWFADGDLDEATQKQLIALKGEENLYLFSGRMPEFIPVLEESGLLELIEQLPEEQQERLLGAVKRYPNDGNHLVIPFKNGVDN